MERFTRSLAALALLAAGCGVEGPAIPVPGDAGTGAPAPAPATAPAAPAAPAAALGNVQLRVLRSDGSPARGATVTVTAGDREQSRTAVADEAGRASIAGLAEDRHARIEAVLAGPPGTREVSSGTVRIRAGVTAAIVVELEVRNTFEVRVLDAAGAPPPPGGRAVMLSAEPSPLCGTSRYRSAPKVELDGRGIARFDAIEPGAYYLGIETASHGDLPRNRVTVPGPRAELRLPAGAQVSGVVRDGQGNPWRPDPATAHGPHVELEVRGKDCDGCFEHLRSVRVEADGSFRLAGLPDGPFRLRMFGTWDVPGPAVDVPGAAEDVVLRVPPIAAIRGRVLDSMGRPVARAEIDLPAAAGAPEAGAYTAEDGTFHRDVPPSGPRVVRATAAGLVSPPVEVVPGGPPVDLVLAAGATIRGRVVDAEGRPVPELVASWGRFEGHVDGVGGAFVLENVPAEVSAIQLRAEGHATREVTVALVAGETLDLGEVRLPPVTRLTGVVLDADGRPAAGAEVRVFFAHSHYAPDEEELTDAEGRFSIGGLAAGELRIEAGLGDQETPEATVELREGEVRSLVLRLETPE